MGPVHAPGAAVGAAAAVRPAPLQTGHQAHVGRPRQRQWREMGKQIMKLVSFKHIKKTLPSIILSNYLGSTFILVSNIFLRLFQVVRLRKTQTGRAWEDLCMAMLGEQFMVGPELCGVVLSVRFQVNNLLPISNLIDIKRM